MAVAPYDLDPDDDSRWQELADERDEIQDKIDELDNEREELETRLWEIEDEMENL
ncbi:hypothetical protein ACOV5J_05645 [Weissella soli]|uniref:hypothetical protein n=1 Tax=Weissella soli TaxID=155866 RepID=UPI003C7454F0